MKDVIVKCISHDSCNRLTMPMMTVYDHPKDYPDAYVARLFGAEEGPSKIIMIADSLPELRDMIRGSGFKVRLNRDVNDDEKILEVWI